MLTAALFMLVAFFCWSQAGVYPLHNQTYLYLFLISCGLAVLTGLVLLIMGIAAKKKSVFFKGLFSILAAAAITYGFYPAWTKPTDQPFVHLMPNGYKNKEQFIGALLCKHIISTAQSYYENTGFMPDPSKLLGDRNNRFDSNIALKYRFSVKTSGDSITVTAHLLPEEKDSVSESKLLAFPVAPVPDTISDTTKKLDGKRKNRN